jgi:hypothetical protein
VDARLEPDQLGAALQDEILAEPVAAVHLEREAAQIAKSFLAHAEQRFPLAPQLACGRGGPATATRRWLRGRRRVGLLPQQAWEQR